MADVAGVAVGAAVPEGTSTGEAVSEGGATGTTAGAPVGAQSAGGVSERAMEEEIESFKS